VTSKESSGGGADAVVVEAEVDTVPVDVDGVGGAALDGVGLGELIVLEYEGQSGSEVWEGESEIRIGRGICESFGYQ
jgi:hypothetical protein